MISSISRAANGTTQFSAFSNPHDVRVQLKTISHLHQTDLWCCVCTHLLGLCVTIIFLFFLQITFLIMVIVISYRQDVMGALYALTLGLLIVINIFGRQHLRRVWGLLLITLAVLVPAQYISALGLPHGICYGQSFIHTHHQNSNIFINH